MTERELQEVVAFNMRFKPCGTCGGAGTISNRVKDRLYEFTCYDCKGTGRFNTEYYALWDTLELEEKLR